MLRINSAKDDVKECFSSDHLRIIFRTLIRDLRIFFEVLRHLALTSKLTNIESCLYLVMDFLLSRQNCNMYKYDAYFLRTRKVHLWFQLLLYLGFFSSARLASASASISPFVRSFVRPSDFWPQTSISLHTQQLSSLKSNIRWNPWRILNEIRGYLILE